MFTSIDKLLTAVIVPAIVFGLGFLGFDLSPEWQAGLVTVVTPFLVWLVPNAT